jgi:predicted nucleotidyltransferase
MITGQIPNHFAIEIPGDAISAFCQKWSVRAVELFGSVLGDDFGPESDVDVLVSFDSDRRPTLFEFIEMQDELETIFNRKVDLLTRHSVETNSNPYRRRSILDSARLVYAK